MYEIRQLTIMVKEKAQPNIEESSRENIVWLIGVMKSVIIQMQSRQLQDYLDAQLERFEGHSAANTYNQLELKLNQIERKLVSLKAEQPQPQTRPAHIRKEKEHKQMRKKKEVACQSDTKPTQKEAETVLVRIEQEAQVTPQKHLNIISKTMSEGNFQMKPKGSAGSKKKGKKNISQAKPPHSHAQFLSNKSPSLQSTAKKQPKASSNNKSAEKGLKQRYSSQKYLSKTQDGQLISHLQKDIDICMKSNAQLKGKVKQLQGYKHHYCKLRDLMNKLERQRKKHQ